MCDLEDFMEDEETKTVQNNCDQFDEVVDIVVSDSRAKAQEKADNEEGQ